MALAGTNLRHSSTPKFPGTWRGTLFAVVEYLVGYGCEVRHLSNRVPKTTTEWGISSHHGLSPDQVGDNNDHERSKNFVIHTER